MELSKLFFVFWLRSGVVWEGITEMREMLIEGLTLLFARAIITFVSFTLRNDYHSLKRPEERG